LYEAGGYILPFFATGKALRILINLF